MSQDRNRNTVSAFDPPTPPLAFLYNSKMAQEAHRSSEGDADSPLCNDLLAHSKLRAVTIGTTCDHTQDTTNKSKSSRAILLNTDDNSAPRIIEDAVSRTSNADSTRSRARLWKGVYCNDEPDDDEDEDDEDLLMDWNFTTNPSLQPEALLSVFKLGCGTFGDTWCMEDRDYNIASTSSSAWTVGESDLSSSKKVLNIKKRLAFDPHTTIDLALIANSPTSSSSSSGRSQGRLATTQQKQQSQGPAVRLTPAALQTAQFLYTDEDDLAKHTRGAGGLHRRTKSQTSTSHSASTRSMSRNTSQRSLTRTESALSQISLKSDVSEDGPDLLVEVYNSSHPQEATMDGGWEQTPEEGLEGELVMNSLDDGSEGENRDTTRLVSLPWTSHQQHQFYAVKIMKRSTMRDHKSLRRILAERDVLVTLSRYGSPFHVQLVNTFKTMDTLIEVEEYVPGGRLGRIVEAGHGLQRDLPHGLQFYTTNLILGLRHLHQSGIVHRNLSMRNILIGSDGYLKISGFSDARPLRSGLGAKTFVGSYEYASPEMCLGLGYSFSHDIWSLGILIYEMMFGRKPFDVKFHHGKTQLTCAEARAFTLINIMSDNMHVHFPSHRNFPMKTRLFVRRLLQKDPEARLGGKHADYGSIMESKWLGNVDWGALEAKLIKAPFLPSNPAEQARPPH